MPAENKVGVVNMITSSSSHYVPIAGAETTLLDFHLPKVFSELLDAARPFDSTALGIDIWHILNIQTRPTRTASLASCSNTLVTPSTLARVIPNAPTASEEHRIAADQDVESVDTA